MNRRSFTSSIEVKVELRLLVLSEDEFVLSIFAQAGEEELQLGSNHWLKNGSNSGDSFENVKTREMEKIIIPRRKKYPVTT